MYMCVCMCVFYSEKQIRSRGRVHLTFAMQVMHNDELYIADVSFPYNNEKNYFERAGRSST